MTSGRSACPTPSLKALAGLTEEEHAVVKRHPEFGHFRCSRGSGSSPSRGVGVAPPRALGRLGLAWTASPGGGIPLGARIIPVADAFEGDRRADRPYRPAQHHGSCAFAELARLRRPSQPRPGGRRSASSLTSPARAAETRGTRLMVPRLAPPSQVSYLAPLLGGRCEPARRPPPPSACRVVFYLAIAPQLVAFPFSTLPWRTP